MTKPRRTNGPAATRAKGPRAHTRRARRRTLTIGGLAACALASMAIYLALPGKQGPTPPRAISTVAANRRVCVLSDPGDTDLPTVDSGLRQAANTNGHLNVQHFLVSQGQSDAAPILNSMISLGCSVIVGLGTQAHAAVLAYASNEPSSSARFIIVANAPANTARLSAIAPADLTSNTVATLVESDEE